VQPKRTSVSDVAEDEATVLGFHVNVMYVVHGDSGTRYLARDEGSRRCLFQQTKMEQVMVQN
jgi:hypothetical protein